MQPRVLTFRFSPSVCKLRVPVFKFLASGTHRFDVSMSVCVTPGYVLGLLFRILWLAIDLLGIQGRAGYR